MLAAAVAAVVAVLLVTAGGGGGPAGVKRKLPSPPSATLVEIDSFVNRAYQALHRRFVATYRISLFRLNGHVVRQRVSLSNWAWNRLLFRAAPAFPWYGARFHATEVLELPSGYVYCTQPRYGSAWWCETEKGEGMSTMAVQNGAIAPQAFVNGLSGAVSALSSGSSASSASSGSSAPYPIFLSPGTVDGRSVHCLSFGSPRGAGGRVCTTESGFVVSYRLQQQLSETEYATAELVRYSTKVRGSGPRPPAKPVQPGQ